MIQQRHAVYAQNVCVLSREVQGPRKVLVLALLCVIYATLENSSGAGIKSRVSHILGNCSTTEPHPSLKTLENEDRS